jgi:hypothetical protein
LIALTEANKLPCAAEVEVLVLGGGPAGVAAAFSAARMGAKTLVVEQFNCLGGVATAGGHGHICLYSAWGDRTRVVGGILWEASQRMVQAGMGICDNSAADFEIEGLKLTLEQMAEECHCSVLYHSFFCDAVVEGDRIVGAVVQDKGGRRFVAARRIVDATGDGDVAARAGCNFEMGSPEHGHCQPVTLMFTIGGVDWPRVAAWRTSYDMAEVWAEAQRRGDMRPFQKCIMGFWWTPTRPDQVGINFTHINYTDSTCAEDLTRATIEGRKQAYESIQVFRKYVPGMEKCYMISTAAMVGIRESRRILGESYMTREDIVERKSFADSIGYGSFFIDIHGTRDAGMDEKTWRPEAGFRYQIPFGILVPKGIDNLLVAGRCASCSHEALGSLRVMPQCAVMGQAAGAASVLSLRAGAPPRHTDVAALQAELRRQSCIVDESDILAANPGAPELPCR